MNDEFHSIEELYQRVRPALRARVYKLSLKGISFVTEDDIWNLLMEKWKRGKNLTLFDIVHDILHFDERLLLDKYKNYKDITNRE
jgi:hypothetical protein